MYTGYFKDAKNPKKTIKRKCYLFIRGGHMYDAKTKKPIENEFLGVQKEEF
jgi:hypothetical protein